MKTYRTKEIAALAHVHPNTVRLYEEWGFISPVPRGENGYRRYNEMHVKQMQIARLAFRNEFIQNNLRKRATKIVVASGKGDFDEALKAAQLYLQHLHREHDYALQAVGLVEELIQHSPEETQQTTYTHQEVAEKLQLTQETIRNWERNGLFSVQRNHRNHRIYTQMDYNKLMMIRTLRSAHFSIASIRLLFEQQKLEKYQPLDIQKTLNSPHFMDEFLHVTDQLEVNLREAIQDTEQIIHILQTLESRL
ncbi:MAG: MerR family transcriptional regulator [Lysinibacillus sp.]